MPSALETIMQQILAQQGASAPMGPRPMAGPQLPPGPFMPEVGLEDTRGQGGRFDGSLDALAAFLARSRGPQLGRHASQGDRFLAGLVGGAGNAWGGNRLSAAAERELFAERQDKQSQARVKERNDAFTDARSKAAKVREERRAQMQRALDRHQQAADAADARARSATDRAVQANHIAARDAALAQRSQVEADLAKLEGRAPKAGESPAKIQPPTPKAVRAAAAAKPATGAAGAKLSKETKQTIDYMRSRGISTEKAAIEYLNIPEVSYRISKGGLDSTSIVSAFK